MPAARYWRIARIEPYDYDAGLVLSEIALYESGVRIDSTATVTATLAPSSGTLADLSDASFATTVAWSAASLFNPGFALVYDFGSNKDITKIGFAGPALNTFVHKFELQLSADGVAWERFTSPVVATKWKGAATFYEVEQNSTDPNFTNVPLLLHFDGPNDATTFTDSSSFGRSATVSGNAKLSTAQAKFGSTAGLFDGTGDFVRFGPASAFHLANQDFTVEAFVYMTLAGTRIKTIAATRAISGTTQGFEFYVGANDSLAFSGYLNDTAPIDLASASGAIPANTWVHVAVSRAGSNTRMFVNGVQVAIDTSSSALGQGTDFYIGRLTTVNTSRDWQGYIDELRVTIGVARYTDAFTPPTSPFPDNTSVDDVYAESVSLLLNGTGANDATVFTDSSFRPKPVTAYGNVKISTAQSKFGGSSILFDGTNSALSVPAGDDFVFGTANFTIEMFVYPLATPNGSALIAEQYTGAGDKVEFAIGFCPAGNIAAQSGSLPFFGVFNGSAWQGAIAANALALNTWHHVALVRVGTVWTLYVNGTSVATANFSYSIALANPIFIGRRWDTAGAASYFNGYIDDLRITKGTARYTANFTPPLSELKLSEFDPAPIRGSRQQPVAISEYVPLDGGISLFAPQQLVIDVEDGGAFKIVGTVKEVALPANLPLARRVRLYEERSGRFIKGTFSDAAGNYEFAEIRGDRPYTVVAFDHTDTYRAVVADKLIAEPM